MRPDNKHLQSLLRPYVYGTDPLVDALAADSAFYRQRCSELASELDDQRERCHRWVMKERARATRAEAALDAIERKPYRAEEIIVRYRESL